MVKFIMTHSLHHTEVVGQNKHQGWREVVGQLSKGGEREEQERPSRKLLALQGVGIGDRIEP
jgi:hypothetical protein